MKFNSLSLLSALLLLPACQTETLAETIRDQDQQLEYAQMTLRQLDAQRETLDAQIAELREQYAFEQERRMEIENRFEAMSASYQATQQEVDELTSRLEGTGVGVSKRGDILVLDLPSAITFNSGSANLNSKGRKSLKTVADILKTNYEGKTFWVEGHTDNDKIKKSKDKWGSNLELSVTRAMTVINYMTQDLKVPANQFRIAGHGEWSPKTENSSTKSKATNRRVEILIF
ncbi:MAG TPA: OmpA family protein [Planctomycetota bacterium]|jgi:chemotaxis protein MotB|nr:OmpA family protein [Planctomycetota bacterium]|tara:strand:+ start:6098 stop:6790 length:693 start_codon:yes stop_codon:yes gene_type:complete